MENEKWLEQIYGEEALKWVEQQNKVTSKKFSEHPNYKEIYDKVYRVLTEEPQIPKIIKVENFFYNFWQDQHHLKGVWRRVNIEKFNDQQIEWETVLDIDVLSAKEGKYWVFHDVDFLNHENQRCLIYLSEDGKDATEIREFDLIKKDFITEGFFLPQAKNQASWINQDEIFILTDFGEESLTQAGYPNTIKKWHRDQDIEQAKVVFQAETTDQMLWCYHDYTKGYEKDVIYRFITFYSSEIYVLGFGQVDVPLNAEVRFYDRWLCVLLHDDWSINQHHYLKGSLICIDFDDFKQGKRSFDYLFKPTAIKVLNEYTKSKDYFVLNVMENVHQNLEIIDSSQNFKPLGTIHNQEKFSNYTFSHSDVDSNEIYLIVESFLTAKSLYKLNLPDITFHPVKIANNHCYVNEFKVSQHFAVSNDGTQVPYFQIDKRSNDNSTPPVLIEGYGGFQISMNPNYLETIVPSWLQLGGVYIVANIRGGGEYGPQWHQAALKQNRHKAYEDFAAVAQDLLKRKVTQIDKLAAIGGSNGGLLIGNMLVKYPHLFKALVCEVPLLDMENYTAYGAGYSWVGEYGDPENSIEKVHLKDISPYAQLNKQNSYPAVLFYTSTNDDRVTPIHARKMAFKMQEMQLSNVYFYEQRKGGHSIFANKELRAFHTALTHQFLFEYLL